MHTITQSLTFQLNIQIKYIKMMYEFCWRIDMKANYVNSGQVRIISIFLETIIAKKKKKRQTRKHGFIECVDDQIRRWDPLHPVDSTTLLLSMFSMLLLSIPLPLLLLSLSLSHPQHKTGASS